MARNDYNERYYRQRPAGNNSAWWLLPLLLLVLAGGWLWMRSNQTTNGALQQGVGGGVPTNSASPNGVSPTDRLSPSVSPTSANNSIEFNLDQQNNSGLSGKAMLNDMGNGTVKVSLVLNQEQNSTQARPAHIHMGSCPNPGDVVYPLSNVVNGRSETVINTTLQNLMSQLPLAINVHQSANSMEYYIACGDLSSNGSR